MKYIYIKNTMFTIKFILLVISLTQIKSFQIDEEVINKFKNWIQKFNIYTKDESHHEHIFNNWLENEEFIRFSNSKNLSYVLDHNKFSLNSEEFSEYMGFENNKEILKNGKLFKG